MYPVGECEVTMFYERASLDSLRSAFRNLKSFGTITIQNFINDKFGLRELTQDVGFNGIFEINTDKIWTSNKTTTINTTSHVVLDAVVSQGYGYEYIYEIRCSSSSIEESFPLQYISTSGQRIMEIIFLQGRIFNLDLEIRNLLVYPLIHLKKS